MTDTTFNTTETGGIQRQFAGIDLQELAKIHGTPLYAYDAPLARCGIV